MKENSKMKKQVYSMINYVNETGDISKISSLMKDVRNSNATLSEKVVMTRRLSDVMKKANGLDMRTNGILYNNGKNKRRK